LLEGAHDPGTTRHLNDLGVAPGWQCLELGGGGGSIAAWLCARVGPTGRVVATDLDTRFLEAIDCPRLEVWRHDLVADDLPEAAFDLVHTRALLCHVPDRQRALDQIVRALRPGGCVLIEEPDSAGEAVIAPPGAVVDFADKVIRAKNLFLDTRGFDRLFARRVFNELTARGLTHVAAQGRVEMSCGGSPLARFYQLTLKQVSSQLAAEGEVSESEIQAHCELLEDPAFLFMWPMMLATWGRKARQ
jgi:SAM-dependent methyltransferase